MKVLIDLDRAVAEGRITPDERARLKVIAGSQTSDLALNILIGFGITAVTVGLLALSGSIYVMAGMGAVLACVGVSLVLKGGERWRLLGEILLVIGSGLLVSGMIVLDEGSARSMLYGALLLGAGAILAENGLLTAVAMLVLAGSLGGSTTYQHARYTLIIEEPAQSVLIFTLLSAALVWASTQLPSRYERIALIAARTGALLVNFAFMVGSLWGDKLRDITISHNAFAIAWAVALLCAGVWAWRENRRWPLVAATVFASIHFYTQWFERIGADPAAVVFAGLLAIAIGYGLKRMLAGMGTPSPTSA